MVIESCSIESFGKLNNVELRFHDNMNVIEGENESGKSTVAAFIRYMLYGFTDRNSESSISDKKRFTSWQTACASGSMTLRTDDGKRYKIHRKTVLSTASGRDVYRETNTITSEDDGSVVFARQNAGDALLRLPYEIFDNVAFVGQFSDSRTSPDTSEAIGNMLFSGDESVNAERALSKLDNARKALLHKSGKGGEIAKLTERQAELEARFSAAVEKNREILENEAILSRTVEELRSTESEIERLCSCIEAYDNIQAAKELSRLHALEEALRMAENSREILVRDNTYEGFCPDGEYITALAVADSRYKEASDALARVSQRAQNHLFDATPTGEFASLTEKLEGNGGAESIKRTAQDKEREHARLQKKARSLTNIGIPLCLILVGVFMIIAGVSAKVKAKRLRSELDALYSSLGVADASGLSRLLSEYETRARAYESAAALHSEAVKEQKSAKESAEAAKEKYISLLAKWGQPENADLEKISERVNAFGKKMSELEAELLRAKGLYLESKEKLKDKNEEQIAAALNEMKPELLELVRSTDINKINEALAFCRSKQKALAIKERDVREKYVSGKAVAESPSELKEKLDAVEEKLRSLKKQHAAYMLASEAIEGAGERLRASISPRLSKSARDAISAITDGKYSELGVDSSLSLSCTDENELRSPEAFSAGTRMAIYLSLRIALIELLCPEKVPLCMDEALAYQDDTRAKRLLDYLLSASKDKTQCFIFTCHKREALMLEGSDAKIIKL